LTSEKETDRRDISLAGIFRHWAQPSFRGVVRTNIVLWVGLAILGVFWRVVWSPLIVIISAYALVDLMIMALLDFKQDTAFVFRRVKVKSNVGYIMFLAFVVLTAFVVDGIMAFAKFVDMFLPYWASAIGISFLVGQLILLDLLLLYQWPLVGQKVPQTELPTPSQATDSAEGQKPTPTQPEQSMP
jgi:hypothetical protein